MRGIFNSACGDKNKLITGSYASCLVLSNMLPLVPSRIWCRCWPRGSKKKQINVGQKLVYFWHRVGERTPPPLTCCPPSVSIHPICPGELSKHAPSLVFPCVQLYASPGHLGSLSSGSIGSAPRSPWTCQCRLEKGCFSFPCDFSIKYLLQVSFVYHFAPASYHILFEPSIHPQRRDH